MLIPSYEYNVLAIILTHFIQGWIYIIIYEVERRSVNQVIECTHKFTHPKKVLTSFC